MGSPQWQPGDTVVLRGVFNRAVWSAKPVLVVEDTQSYTALYLPVGTRWKQHRDFDGAIPRFPPQQWTLEDSLWHSFSLLILAPADAAYNIFGFFDATWTLSVWYVNIQTPLARTSSGFDFWDQYLDALIMPDRQSWEWKDEDEFAEAIARGFLTRDEAIFYRAAAYQAIGNVLNAAFPFERRWDTWRPPDHWTIPELPEGWDTTPVAKLVSAQPVEQTG